MARCSDIDPLLTPYVDGETPEVEQARVEAHLGACPPCQRHADAEQAARTVLRAHASGLIVPAPSALRARCTGSARHARAWSSGRLVAFARRTSWPVALAATLVLALGGVLAYGLAFESAEAVAAQLTLDHLKCFALFTQLDQPGLDPVEVQATLKSRYGWTVTLPGRDEADGLTLVGGRRCMYLDGAVAHLLYKRGGVPVSVFVLPEGVSLDTGLQVMGHAAVTFRRGGRTHVVLARESRADVERLAGYFERPGGLR